MLAQVKDELKKCGPSIFNELMQSHGPISSDFFYTELQKSNTQKEEKKEPANSQSDMLNEYIRLAINEAQIDSQK